ncbi:MAG: hypothetical protein CBC83_05820 [Flavobacteriales bacterium TMED123]|nr:MAG: hypothetical protein CBC83_05820 [Flavobacteriales bacterium TMED123]|tara:strand:+ start:4555 stop:5499 length:945 start_codon:yes stop_codon:yes gene_type:complete
MKQPIAHYISHLLYLHDCVIIPGFGGFVGKKKSAYIHPVLGIIYPPSKVLLFNKNLSENDGLLATHITKEEGIDLYEVSILIEEFVQKIQNELVERSAFKLQKIGTFSKGKEGNISFMQDNSYNYNLASFGMQANLKNKKLERTIKDGEKGVVKTIKEKDFTKTLTRAAAIFIPLVGLSLIGITQEEKINTIYGQMANLNPFNNTKKTEVVVEQIEITTEAPVVEIIQPIEAEEIVNPVIPQHHAYYIIAGAFAEQKNANKLLQKLKRWNYNASILEGGNLMRVSYNSFSNKEDALLALAEIRKENNSAWLLTK